MASLIWLTLQIGILKAAPAEVLMVSAFIGALPLCWMIIPFTPVHSAVLMMAPKFLTSDIWSKIKNRGVLVFSKLVSIKFSKSANSIGDIWATAPWWFLFLESLLSFSTGTKLVVIFSFLIMLVFVWLHLKVYPFHRPQCHFLSINLMP